MFKELQINEQIRDKEVRLLDGTTQIGIVPVQEAQRMAYDKGMDLVKISPNAVPPVCKIMDYGKYRYDCIKKDKETKKNQKIVEVKETQLSPTIDIGDINIKAKRTKEFLEQGNKVKIVCRMKGRQQAHPEIGMSVVTTFLEKIADSCVVEKAPVHEGRNITAFVAPIPQKK